MQDIGTDDADDANNVDVSEGVDSDEVDKAADVDLSDAAGVESGEVDESGDVGVAENADSVEAVDDKYVVLVAEAVTYVT